MPRKLVEMLRSLRYALGDLLFVIGRVSRAFVKATRAAWQRLSLSTRRRAAVAFAAVAVVAIVRLAIVPALPCSFPGGDECATNAHDAALSLVPSNAVAYVHSDFDRSREQYAKAVGIASRTPLLTRQIGSLVLSQFLGSAGQRSDFSNQIRPWLDSEIVIATLPSDDGGGQIQMLQVADHTGAEAYAKSIESANPQISIYRGVEVSVDGRGLATAITNGFLLIGREAGVRAVIDVATKAQGTSSMASDPTTSKVRDELPGDSIVDAYVSSLGIPGLFSPGTTFAPAAQFVDPAASKGFGIAVVAEDDGFELSTASSIDPAKAAQERGAERNALASLPGFDPSLAERVQGDALAYLGIGDPESTLQGLLQSVGTQAPGVLGDLSRVLRRLGKGGNVDLASELLPSLGDEAAFALIPRVDAGSGISGDDLPGQADPTQTLPPGAGAIPYIELLARVSDEDGATQGLAMLQESIAAALGAKGRFAALRLGGVEAQTLRISPAAQVAYAVFDSLFAFSTDPAGVRTTADPASDPLSSSDLYQRATDGLPSDPSLLAFFNATGLLQFAEASGQAANPAYATFASDLRRIEGLAVSVDASGDLISTDSRVLISATDLSQFGG